MDTKESRRGAQSTLLIDLRQEARRALEQEVRSHPDFADCHNRLGLLELLENRPEKAVSCFRRAVKLNPNYVNAQFNLRLAQQAAGKAEEIQIPAPAQEGTEAWVHGRIEEVWSCLRSRDIDCALDILDQLAKCERYRILGWIYGAFVLVKAERWREASERLCAAYQSGAAAAQVLSFWDFTPEAEDPDPDRLRELIDQVSWYPTLSDLYDEMGLICARNGLPDEARSEFYRSFLVWPLESHFHLRMADLAQAEDREEETLTHLSRAIECEPTNVRGRIALGFEYASQGFVDEAIVQFEVAAKLEPDFPDVRYNLGLLYLNQGREGEAVRHLERALMIHEDYVPARSALAMALLKMKRPDEALRHYQTLIDRGVKTPDILAHAAEALMEHKDLDRAAGLLEEARKQWPSYPRSYYLLGRLYRKKGLRRKAQWAWQRFLEVSGEWEPLDGVENGEVPKGRSRPGAV
ncbi:MAG: tetratricopeptide repeat protein [Candidatus Eisenbacteria bacterium]|nr:tetratricopeptide repeat protein [Candidatus Eisenbacteria bacterium]